MTDMMNIEQQKESIRKWTIDETLEKTSIYLFLLKIFRIFKLYQGINKIITEFHSRIWHIELCTDCGDRLRPRRGNDRNCGHKLRATSIAM